VSAPHGVGTAVRMSWPLTPPAAPVRGTVRPFL
jgi:hypothetical protein